MAGGARARVEVRTEKVWTFAKDYDLSRVILINKLDKERADFKQTLANVQEVLDRRAVAVHLPIGSEKSFHGIVDLINEKAYIYEADGDGKGKGKAKKGEEGKDGGKDGGKEGKKGKKGKEGKGKGKTGKRGPGTPKGWQAAHPNIDFMMMRSTI